MMTRISGFLYWHCQPLWQLWARWRCPIPVGREKSARACFEAGECGCDNQFRRTRR
jgi:hypothetical protein